MDFNTKAVATARELLEFIDKSPSCYHAIDNIKDYLSDYTELKEEDSWELTPGQGYYVVRNSSSIIAFRIPESADNASFGGFRIAATHSDSPVFKLKPNAEMEVDKKYIRLNTEKYGGMILSTWLDRPLSIAGRVFAEKKGHIQELHINLDKDLLIIPNVAVHLNRDSADGVKLNPQIDMLPLYACATPDNKEATTGSLMSIIAEEAEVNEESIFGSDLFIYNRARGTFLGPDNELIASRALDNLQCTYGVLKGFLDSVMTSGDKKEDTNTAKSGFNNPNDIPVFCVFDNEEVGSLTKQGADSTFLIDTLSRISKLITGSDDYLRQAFSKSFMISADNAHALHPNHSELSDPTNKPYINGGVVIKYNANQKYTTDGQSEAYLRLLCKKAAVPVQTYTNRSNIAGGSTLGNLSSAHVSVSTVDIGLPQLAMHSSYETAGTYDTQYLIQLMKVFYSI